MDFISFSRQFYAVVGLPVTLFENGHVIYSSLAECLGITAEDNWPFYEPDRNPEFSATHPDLEYGHVRIEGTGYDLFLGPLFTSSLTDQLIREYFKDAKTPPDQQEATRELLYTIPHLSHARFVRLLFLLHFIFNGKEADMEDFYAEREQENADRGLLLTDNVVDARETEQFRSSYDFERELYHHILQGDTMRLKRFLEGTKVFPSEGTLAHTPLRNAKNTLIGLAAKVCVMAAIPGGMDAERAYQLADLYTLECEQMQSLKEVHRLQYVMLMDFCQRCSDAKLPEGISSEVYRCMTYIQNHTNAVISLDDVASQVGRSTSYLMRRFKAELGVSIGEYITKCKLEEACELLTYSEWSLAEVSAYLGYSSQSYFQNVFKKQYGMTPLQYRKQ